MKQTIQNMGEKIMTITVEITEGNGKTWIDEQWILEPDEEDCVREYNTGCLVVVYEDGNEIDSYET